MQLPYLVSNVVEILDPLPEDMIEEMGSAEVSDHKASVMNKTAVVKTTMRQVIFLYKKINIFRPYSCL